MRYGAVGCCGFEFIVFFIVYDTIALMVKDIRERRKFPRAPLKRSILWRGAQTLDNLHLVSNISEGGVLLVLDRAEAKVGDRVHLQIPLPTNYTVHANAEVVWLQPHSTQGLHCSAGLAFSVLNDADLSEVRHFVGVCRYGCDL